MTASPGELRALRLAFDALEIKPGEEWWAQIGKDGYDLHLETAKYRQRDGSMSSIVGRFACGEYAIKCLPVVAQAMNALPGLLDRIAELEAGLEGMLGDGNAGTWMSAVEPLIARFTTAAQFGADAVHNGEGAQAIADLMKAMAAKLDGAILSARSLLSPSQQEGKE